ncbi:Extracellular_nuclease [Hexamita inflata]|uniref:Extracellular_nuclease n=1 Tax=Hexamita inflata TaxID=28002 RepID=A0ABP1HNY6_9EUKA
MQFAFVLCTYFPGLTGKKLREALQPVAAENHRKLGYDTSRMHMYSYIYNDAVNNSVECLYTGLMLSCGYNSYNTSCNPDLNCEHSVPQSLFHKQEPMKSDLHHLRPTWSVPNNARSNNPFDDLEELKIDKYYGINKQVTVNKPTDPENWSKIDNNVAFEVRDIQKGDSARAVAYFFVMYPTEAGPITRTFANVDRMIEWDKEHLPTELQIQQYKRAVEKQGNVNPFYEEVGLVARAYCDMSTKYPCSLYE